MKTKKIKAAISRHVNSIFISDTDLSIKTQNALHNAGKYTIGNLLDIVPVLGKISWKKEIKTEIRQFAKFIQKYTK